MDCLDLCVLGGFDAENDTAIEAPVDVWTCVVSTSAGVLLGSTPRVARTTWASSRRRTLGPR
eukprot:15554858-Heterocapsa_arctica.AAC.1